MINLRSGKSWLTPLQIQQALRLPEQGKKIAVFCWSKESEALWREATKGTSIEVYGENDIPVSHGEIQTFGITEVDFGMFEK